MPAFVSVVAIEGVLGSPSRSEPDNAVKMGLIEPGHALFKALRQVGTMILVTNFSDRDKVEHWLKVMCYITEADYEKLYIRKHADGLLDEVQLRMHHLSQVRGLPMAINLFVDANPDAITLALEQGMPSVYFLHPSYARGEHQPGGARPARPWDEVVTAVTKQRELHATDPRRDNP